MNRLARMGLKALCVVTFAAVSSLSAHAQNISTIAGNPVLTGRSATAVSVYEPTAVATDATGNVYFATGEFTSQVYKFSTGGNITLVAGNGIYGSSGNGGLATSAELSNPSGVAVDGSGNVYIADTDNNVIREVNATTGDISIVAGNGAAGYSGDTGLATSAELSSPSGVAVDGSGNIYIADTGNNVIRKVTISTGDISTVAGDYTLGAGYSGNGGLATSAQLNYPAGVAVDTSSPANIYIADTDNSVIRKVTASTGDISTVAGDYTLGAGYSGNGGLATSAQLNYPAGVTVDTSSPANIYIADTFNYVIRKVTASTGDISTVAGNNTYGYSGNGGSATSAELGYTQGAAVDSSGDIFIADELNYVIREVSAASSDISTVAGNGYYSYSGDGGLATNAQFDDAYALTEDVSGNLYFADTYNSRIRAVYAQGTLPNVASPTVGDVYTVAGNGTWGTTCGSGAATSAELGYPQGLAVDTSGDIYIADSDINVICEVNASTGTISTIAGTPGTTNESGDGGPASAALFDTPGALALDRSGNLYIADTGNLDVRKINSSGYIFLVAGTGAYGYTGDGGQAVDAELGDPTGLALDNSGDLFIADAKNMAIREVSLNPADSADLGIIETVAGGGSTMNPGLPTALANALMSPAGVYVDYSANIFVSDNVLSQAFEVTGSSFATPPTTGAITTVAGTGTPGYNGDGIPAISAELFAPYTLTGDIDGNLLISDLDNLRIRSVAGIVTPTPALGVSPTSLIFTQQDIGQGPSAAQTVTLTNAGLSAITLSPFTITGANETDFAETTTCTGSLAANSTCTISVTFTASVNGGESAALTVASSAATSPQTVTLTGSGVSAPESTLSASLLIFPTQLLNSGATDTQSVTITNDGTEAMTVSSIAVSGANAADFTASGPASGSCYGATVAAGSTCSINVTFTATVAGSEAATLTINSTAPGSPQTVTLSGAGITFAAPSAAPGGSTSATVTAGSTATYMLQIVATGGATPSDSLTLSLSCAGAPAMATCSLPTSVVASPATPGAFTLSVSTTSTVTLSLEDRLLPKGIGLALIGFGAIMLGKLRKRRKLLTGLFLLGLLAVAISSVGCTGPGLKSQTTTELGTPAGTSSLTVTATVGGVTQSTPLTLIVQQ